MKCSTYIKYINGILDWLYLKFTFLDLGTQIKAAKPVEHCLRPKRCEIRGQESLGYFSPHIQVWIRPLEARGCLDLWQKLSSENCGLWDGGLTVTLAPRHLCWSTLPPCKMDGKLSLLNSRKGCGGVESGWLELLGPCERKIERAALLAG